MNRTMKRMALPIGAALILGSSGFAYMSAGTQAPSWASTQSSPINAFTVSNITHLQDQGDLTYVNFDADADGTNTAANDPANAQISFNDSGEWYNCTRTSLSRNNTPSAHFMCDLRGIGVTVGAIGTMQTVVTH